MQISVFLLGEAEASLSLAAGEGNCGKSYLSLTPETGKNEIPSEMQFGLEPS